MSKVSGELSQEEGVVNGNAGSAKERRSGHKGYREPEGEIDEKDADQLLECSFHELLGLVRCSVIRSAPLADQCM